MKIYDIYKNYEGLGYAEPDMEDVERRAREAGAADGEVDGYNDGYESGKTDADYSKMYLTIEALSGGTFYVRNADVSYSVNGADWETTTGVTALSLNQGDAVRFKGTSWGFSLFSNNTLTFNAYGNVESLGYSDNFEDETGITTTALSSLFKGCAGLVDASNLILPATTLANGCYQYMFKGCTSLTTAPVLPATTLAKRCYYYMFNSCSSLTTAPELPATTLAESCYERMFLSCTSLTTSPELPASALTLGCYSYMFYFCSNLNSITCLATDISAINCLANWVVGVASTGTFETPSTTNWKTGLSGIPKGWARVDVE